jgi:xylulose-5-phosphate/fructose-6-phosphate phosphoketolase
MLRLNKVSRYDLADVAVHRVAKQQPNHPIVPRAHQLAANWKHELVKHERYTLQT